MMIHAYQEIYVNNAQTMLGDAFDYAINTCHISGDDFVKMFVVSSFSKRIENGEPACVAGKSGIELVHEIVFETMQKELNIESEVNYSRSCEYWIGWAVAYYQWYSDRSFKEIFNVLSFEDLKRMYYTLHEADISKFVDIVDSKMKEYYVETNLKRIRTTYGYTQQELPPPLPSGCLCRARLSSRLMTPSTRPPRRRSAALPSTPLTWSMRPRSVTMPTWTARATPTISRT